MADLPSWMIRKATGPGVPFDAKPASIVGPDTDNVTVVPAEELSRARTQRDIAEVDLLLAREALAFYADEGNWQDVPDLHIPAIRDRGQRAREALGSDNAEGTDRMRDLTDSVKERNANIWGNE